MAKFVRCEYCKKEAALREPMSFMPYGWIETTLHREGPNADYIACSIDCMAALLMNLATEGMAQ